MGHRLFQPTKHRWRRSNKFNGKHEQKNKPDIVTGAGVLLQMTNIPPDVTFGKHPDKRKRKRSDLELNWTKLSIFFKLPYWKKLKLRHNLDVMHTEKNICENILGTLMNINGKTKDNLNSRLDLELLGLMPELHPKRVGDKYICPLHVIHWHHKRERVYVSG